MSIVIGEAIIQLLRLTKKCWICGTISIEHVVLFLSSGAEKIVFDASIN